MPLYVSVAEGIVCFIEEANITIHALLNVQKYVNLFENPLYTTYNDD